MPCSIYELLHVLSFFGPQPFLMLLPGFLHPVCLQCDVIDVLLEWPNVVSLQYGAGFINNLVSVGSSSDFQRSVCATHDHLHFDINCLKPFRHAVGECCHHWRTYIYNFQTQKIGQDFQVILSLHRQLSERLSQCRLTQLCHALSHPRQVLVAIYIQPHQHSQLRTENVKKGLSKLQRQNAYLVQVWPKGAMAVSAFLS